MLKTHFKIALRNLWKNKSFTLINLAGLSLGLASVMTLVVLVEQYYSTDDFQANKERLYYLKTFNPDWGPYRQTAAAKAFGWTNPVGKRIKGKGSNDVKTVIGVMKDFHFSTLESPIEPLLHSYPGKPELTNMTYLSLRLDRKQAGKIMTVIEQAFKDMPARRPFSYHYMYELVDGQYALLDGILIVTNHVGVLTILG